MSSKILSGVRIEPPVHPPSEDKYIELFSGNILTPIRQLYNWNCYLNIISLIN